MEKVLLFHSLEIGDLIKKKLAEEFFRSGYHLLDMVLFFCNQFNKIHSFVSNNFWSHEVEDNAYVLMRDNTGIVGTIHSSAPNGDTNLD